MQSQSNTALRNQIAPLQKAIKLSIWQRVAAFLGI
jgi:hypothetical protein